MSNRVFEVAVQCPHCWETFTVLIDGSVTAQEYIEDCEVCCRPIDFDVAIDDDEQPVVQARHPDA